MSGLTIYRASAGSGKTHTLARDFIRLVITDPGLYRHILAVTFTNKATDEMKTRILEELHELTQRKASSIMDFISSETALTVEEVAGRARIILESVLHDYSRFHIETIDRFFQRAIRAFTREIGLSGGYRIELDSARVLSESIDRMLVDLDGDPLLLDWFVEFARERIQEGKHWNLKTDLMLLGKELNKERFQARSEALIRELGDRERFAGFRKELLDIRIRFETTLKGYARKALGMMEEAGLEPGDFKGQYGVGHFFSKILKGDFRTPTATVLKALDDPSEWVAKSSRDADRINSVYQGGMNDLLRQSVLLFERQYPMYKTAESVRGFLYTLGIMTDISRRMHSFAESEDIFLLSDAARFLYGIIGENDAPFVYEKIGNHFHHFMIDEFQDTSGLQWKNFKPLIENSLAYDRNCLVVGDVKQSIYRWRNSDWEILSEQVFRDFPPRQLELKGLLHNWRSLGNIIRFNNRFFSEAREIISAYFQEDGADPYGFAEKTARAYADVEQEIPEEKEGGYVRISLVSDPEEGNWKDHVDIQVIKTIEQLQDRGIGPSDTAILVRTRREGKRIADAILAYKSLHADSKYVYNVISSESLYLSNAVSVRIMVGALRYLVSPGDKVNLARLVYDYHLLQGPVTGKYCDPGELFEGIRTGSTRDLPGQFMDESLRYLTLTELMERIIALFSLDRHPAQSPYILGFQDLVLEYCRNGAADVNSFLNWWDENGEEQALKVSEDQNAVQIMTIHKAKGLEFRAVIIPYCNWYFDHRGPEPEILWCSSDLEPFNRFSLLPVRYSMSLKDTIYKQDYLEERFKIYMDHLNLLYVAFTRARECLIVMAPRGKEERFTDVAALLGRVLDTRGAMPGGGWNDTQSTWTLGEFSFRPAERKKRNTFNLRSISSHEFSGKLRLVYRGTEFFDPVAEQRVHYGNLMHEIFSRITTAGDVGRAIDSVRREGLIDLEHANRLMPEISRMLESETVRDWFDGSWKVITERDILTREGSLKRPDRVMMKGEWVVVVDYKFGIRKLPGHRSQVRKYTKMLMQMKYKEVRGFLWYVNRNEIMEV